MKGLKGASWGIEEVLLARLETHLREILAGDKLAIKVKGSFAKGTQTSQSDVDIVATTNRAISRGDKENVVKHLQKLPMFHESHIALKQVAIGCTLSGVDVDLVFANTQEYGMLPESLEEHFVDNPAAQNAEGA